MMFRTLWVLLALWVGVPPARAAESYVDAAQNLRGERVIDVVFHGEGLSDQIRTRFSALARKEFNPSAIRAILLWYHESGGESHIEVRVSRAGGGVRLHIVARQKRRIREIKFEGNTTVPSNTLLLESELKEGMEYESALVNSAAERLSLFYSKQGYLASEVKYSFDPERLELRFIIREGDPTLLHSFGISPLLSVEKKDLRSRYERELAEAFGLKIGDRIQRDRVLEGIQAVKDWLRDHDFLLARDPTLEYKVSEAGEVGLFLNIDYGPRIRYGFRGNTHFSYRELMALVSEVKEVSSGTDYLTSVRRRVLDAYRDIGLANTQITTLVREDSARGIRYISLIVSEGEKIRIDRLNIEGVYSMSAEDAKDKFQSLGSRLVQRSFFDEKGLNRAAELFAEYLKSQGYLSARLEFVKLDFNETRSKVNVTVLFSEGIQTRVRKVEIEGVKRLSLEEVRKTLGVVEGQPFNIFAFEQGLIDLKEMYQQIGNLGAQIVNEGSDTIVRYSQDNSEVSLLIEVDEGPVYHVGDIFVRGNQQTHARVVLRELPFITGDVLTTPLLNETEEFLRKLNIFSSVVVRPIDRPGTEDVKDILILVEETEPGSFDIVPGYRNDLGLRLGFEFGYQNLGGWNRSVNASAVFNRRLGPEYRYPEYRFSVGFREPYLANWPVVFTTNLDVLKRQYSNFDANVSRLVVGVQRELSRTFTGFLEYGYERSKISNVKIPPYSAEDERTDLIGSLTPGFILDSRNDRFNPSKGVHSINRFEVASRFFGAQERVGYYRTTSYNSAYFNLFSDVVFAAALNIGWERSNVFGEPIPSLKLFRLGGLGSIRGYAEDAIEVQSSKNIEGSLGMLNYRGELRIPVFGSFGTALFLDAGNLMVDRFTFSPENLRSSIGAGLRYTTPVGPVLLDFAWRLQTDSEVGDTRISEYYTGGTVDRFRIHFAIGAF
jgi:outer membrane protein assembly complex protein YaeT